MDRSRFLLRAVSALVLALSVHVHAQVVAAVPSQSVSDATVVQQYAQVVHASYDDVLIGALALKQRVDEFVAQPSPERLQAARQAWLDAREWYGQTEAFRFYAGPIDSDGGPEGRINAWPLDESYIDSVKGRAKSGLINNRKVGLTKASLARYNERGGEENIAAGWHAIEFLLWGQDAGPTSAGQRSFEDFVDGKAANADRRRQYLVVATELLVDDLRSLVSAWAPGVRNYRQSFERGGMESVRKMVVGLGSLSRGELAGERMEVALNTQDQEDEHSCFSDNTHRDIVTNARGIENVWLGRYLRRDGTRIDGASLRALVAAKDAALAERVTAQLAQSVLKAEQIQAPFDQEIIGGKDAPGRKRVQAVIDSLVTQSKDLVQAAGVLGITRLTLTLP